MRVTNHEIYSARTPADSFGCHAHIVGVAPYRIAKASARRLSRCGCSNRTS